MLESFKRLFSSSAGPEFGPELRDAAAWARTRGFGFKRAREDEGFVVDGAFEGHAWRMEWGPPQRAYIEGRELRLRIELGLPGEMQMLVMTRALMEQLERQTYDKFVADMQTQIDTSSPEEVRWLVMFPKVGLTASKTLRASFGAVAAAAAMGALWLDGALANELDQAGAGWLAAQPPFVLMTLRGRLYLRLQMALAEAPALAAVVALFEVATAQALRVAGSQPVPGGSWVNSGSTAWQNMQPEDLDGKP